jgi:GNAT superfamily N-acetyltransferase
LKVRSDLIVLVIRIGKERKMSTVNMKEIQTEQELKEVLEFCYNILGTNNMELYGYDAWHKRFEEGLQPLVYAMKDEKIVSAILGRAENQDSLVIGFVACHENYRKQGITKALLSYFEDLARKKGFKYITLGSEEDAFYEKCGYQVIFQIHDQNIFQKIL